MNFRFANAEDAAPFAKWAAENPDIPTKDIAAALKENNPTATVLIVEDDEGRTILYVPIYCTVRIAYLGFNPAADARERISAMNKMLEAIKAFAANFGINQVDTLTKTGYPVAQWAEKHGFNPEDRELFELKGFINV